MSSLRIQIAEQMGLRKPDDFAALWVTEFPLLEWDNETQRYHDASPFYSSKKRILIC